MTKSRVSLQLKEAVIGPSYSTCRSGDLVLLLEQFSVLKLNIQQLLDALKAHHKNLVQMYQTKMEVSKRIAQLAVDTVLTEVAGSNPGHDSRLDPADFTGYYPISFAANKNRIAYADKYVKIIEYVSEWQRIVVASVTVSVRKAEILRRDLDHYQQKVDAMKLEISKHKIKGRMADPKQDEKLSRNEEKLDHARREYDYFASNLCEMIEEVTKHGWKDLHPVLFKMATADVNLATEECDALVNLKNVQRALSVVAEAHGLKPQGRLHEIESMGHAGNSPSPTSQRKSLETTDSRNPAVSC